MLLRNVLVFLNVQDEESEQIPNHTVANPFGGDWQNIFVKREGSLVTVYLDNVQVASGYLTDNHLELDSDNQIGLSHFDANGLQGELRNMSFFTYALGDTERGDLYASGN